MTREPSTVNFTPHTGVVINRIKPVTGIVHACVFYKHYAHNKPVCLVWKANQNACVLTCTSNHWTIINNQHNLLTDTHKNNTMSRCEWWKCQARLYLDASLPGKIHKRALLFLSECVCVATLVMRQYDSLWSMSVCRKYFLLTKKTHSNEPDNTCEQL